ncbi:MAG: carbohydrate-binding domain-containing protein [Ruminococcus sp.]|nr:carbohydrate-binding domain-containing protein [Ruminococcus sp.]
MKKKLIAAVLCGLMLSASLTACGNNDTSETTAAPAATVDTQVKNIQSDINIDLSDIEGSIDLNNAYTITLNGTSATTDAAGVEIDGGKVKITAGGVYRISGNLSDGQIKVKTEADDESVVLILDGADITNKSGAAIHIKNALSAYVVALSGTTNTVADTANYEFAADDTDGEPDAAIFSKADLIIGGKGTLNVNANYSAGIKGKDNLYITDAALNVTSVDDGIKGRDSLNILGGALTVTAENDGIKTTNDQDADLGNLIISGGTLNITSGTDGIQSENTVAISGGDITVKTADGAAETNKQNFGMWGNANTSDSASAKGIKATNDVTVTGGTININSADDSIHSNGNITVSGGEITLASSDDGMHADSELTVSGGIINVTQSYEGLEGQVITITDGDIKIKSSDDGINAAGGNDSSQQGGFGGGDPFASDSDAMITVSGGSIYINADGDGFDSNGSAQMSGGALYVDGPTNSGNGALDFGSEFVLTGGTLIAAGASGMAEKPADSSTQTTIQVELGPQNAGSKLTVVDSTGNEVISYTPAKAYQNVVISTPLLKQGDTYTVYVDGTEVTTIETTSAVTSQGGSNMGGGMGGGQPGGNMGGNQPGGMGGVPNGNMGGRGGMGGW